MAVGSKKNILLRLILHGFFPEGGSDRWVTCIHQVQSGEEVSPKKNNTARGGVTFFGVEEGGSSAFGTDLGSAGGRSE